MTMEAKLMTTYEQIVEAEQEESNFPHWGDWTKSELRIDDTKAGEEAERKRLQRAGEEQERALHYCRQQAKHVIGPKETERLQVTGVRFTKLSKDVAEFEKLMSTSKSTSDKAAPLLESRQLEPRRQQLPRCFA